MTLLQILEARFELENYALFCGETPARHKDARDLQRAIQLLQALTRYEGRKIMTQIDQAQMERELFRAAHDGHDYACAKCGQGCGVMGHPDECPPPEVWRDDEYGEGFWAWGRHDHTAMLIGAQACVDNGQAEGEWSNYEEAARCAKVEYLLAYPHEEQTGNPRLHGHESWRVKAYYPGHGPDEEPVTKLQADPEW